MQNKKNMIMVEGSQSLFIVKELPNGNYDIKAYVDDQSDEGNGSKLWWSTERKPNGESIISRHTMEPIKAYNELEQLAIKVINKYKDQ